MRAVQGGSTTGTTGTKRGTRRWLGRASAALLAVFLVLAPATTARATAPVDLGGAYVLDEANVLSSSQQSRVESAVQELYTDTKTQLYVVFVPTFTDPTDHTQWGAATMSANQIDRDSILLSIAVDERNYDVQQTNETSISKSDVQTAVDDDLLPALKQSDWAGGAVAFANGLTATQAPPNLTPLWILLLVVVIALVVIVLVIRTRNKRRTAAATEAQEASLADLERTAGGALVTIDDELHTAEQEVGFATAQFGADAAKPFADAVTAAQRSVRKAFTFQQQLDDEIPDSPQQRADWANQIIAICQQAHASIEEQTESFDALRSLEDGVDDASVELARAVAAAPSSIDAARASLERVRSARAS